MNIRLVLGLVVFVVGIAMMPFGWWLARIYYYGGLLLAVAGAALAFSTYRRRKHEDDGWSPPNDPSVPVVGEARGFKGRATFEHSQGDSSDATD
jgi:hypothetical protein